MKENDRKISIIIPCYNVEKYISQCLDSLKDQTIGIGHLEIILVNDASTDQTSVYLKKFTKEYPDNVKVITLVHNRKQGGARNEGLRHASGEYVAFLDADDWVDATLYQKLYDIAKKYDTDIIQYPMLKYYEGITRLEDPAQIKGLIVLEDEEMRKLFLAGQALTCGSQTKFYKRKFLEQVGVRFVEGMAYEEPSFVYPLLFYAKRVYCTEEPLYYYRMHEESTMHQYVRQLGKLYEHAMVQWEVLRDIKCRDGLWAKYRDEIVYYFVLTYYLETLHFAGSCDLQLDLEKFREMQKIVREEVPEYIQNPYLQSDTFDYKEFLPLLNRELTLEELKKYCEKAGRI